MGEHKIKIPWFTVFSIVLSTIVTFFLEKIVNSLIDFFWSEYVNMQRKDIIWIIIFTVIIVTSIINYIHYYNSLKKQVKCLGGELEELKSLHDEVQFNWENAEQTLAMAQYVARGYEDLDGYYKKLASIIKVRGSIEDSMIMEYVDKIKSIVMDNCSVREGRINVTLFYKPQKDRARYKICLSNYHTVHTKNVLTMNKKSFVGKVFKDKKVKYIPDIDKRGLGDAFVERENTKFTTILGVPYVVDDVTMYVVIITMEKAGVLDKVHSECLPLIERYVQVIGLLLMFKKYMEEK